MLKSLIPFELIFIHGVRWESNFIFFIYLYISVYICSHFVYGKCHPDTVTEDWLRLYWSFYALTRLLPSRLWKGMSLEISWQPPWKWEHWMAPSLPVHGHSTPNSLVSVFIPIIYIWSFSGYRPFISLANFILKCFWWWWVLGLVCFLVLYGTQGLVHAGQHPGTTLHSQPGIFFFLSISFWTVVKWFLLMSKDYWFWSNFSTFLFMFSAFCA